MYTSVMSFKMKAFTILVEGNIGVGKSTFLKYFERFDSVEVIPEPIEKWRNLNGSNLLDLVYKDPQKWGFPFQSYAALLMLQNHLKPTEKKIKIMERSMFSGYHCFNKLLREENNLKKEEYEILQAWSECMEKNFDIRPDLIVYLRASPEKVYDRMKQRNRCEEAGVSLNYLKRLHSFHENWLVHNKNNIISAPVIVLDAGMNEEQIRKDFEESRKQFFDY